MALKKDFQEKMTEIRIQREEALVSDRKLLSELKTLKSEISDFKDFKVIINDNGQLIMKKLLGELKNTSIDLKKVNIPSEVRRLVTLGDHAKDRLWGVGGLYLWNENKRLAEENESLKKFKNNCIEFVKYMEIKNPKSTKAFFDQK